MDRRFIRIYVGPSSGGDGETVFGGGSIGTTGPDLSGRNDRWGTTEPQRPLLKKSIEYFSLQQTSHGFQDYSSVSVVYRLYLDTPLRSLHPQAVSLLRHPVPPPSLVCPVRPFTPTTPDHRNRVSVSDRGAVPPWNPGTDRSQLDRCGRGWARGGTEVRSSFVSM